MTDALQKAIRVWTFREAPESFKALSSHGGDEDWVALVPPHLANTYITWLQAPHFAACDVSEHPLPDGSVVFIGAHA